ncbi:MAG: aldo/keto reductase [Anaerolineaceae bacterium]|nr:aldo/keto reductase [Anaerolineaceae bacterium]
MIFKDFGKLGWPVSAVSLGTWNIGNQWGDIDDATAWATVRSAYDNGVNLFDTAESYGIPNGLSEQRLGVALAGIRHNVYIVSKIGNWGKRTGDGVPKNSVDMFRLCGHGIVGRLRTDYIDVVLCHEGNLEDPTMYLEGFEALKDEGYIRAYGISTNSLDVLKNFNVNGTCSVVQVDYSLLNRAPEAEFLPYCQQNGIAVMVRGPLAMGLLSGRYSKDTKFEDTVRTRWHQSDEQQAAFEAKVDKVEKLKGVVEPGEAMVTAALRFAASHPAVSTVIPGAKSAQQAATNAQAGDRLLDESELAALTNAVG